VASSRDPNAWTPLGRGEIAELRRELTRKSTEELSKDFATAIEMWKLPYGLNDALPRGRCGFDLHLNSRFWWTKKRGRPRKDPDTRAGNNGEEARQNRRV